MHKDVFSSKAFILHRFSYQENSLIVNVFSEQQGKISLIAKGAKNSKKNIGHILQPFIELELNYIVKESLSILTQADLIFHFKHRNTKIIYCAYYMNELLIRLLSEGEQCKSIYELYKHALSELFTKQLLEKTLRSYEINLLSALGYQLNTEYDCMTGKPIEHHSEYIYIENTGFVENNYAHKYDKLNRLIKISGKSIVAIHQMDFSIQEVNTQIKHLMRIILRQYLGDKPLKSRETYQQLLV